VQRKQQQKPRLLLRKQRLAVANQRLSNLSLFVECEKAPLGAFVTSK